jgi:hypothetical protein
LRQIALEKGADKALSPGIAGSICASQKRRREAATQPQPVELVRPCLVEMETVEGVESNPAGQGLRGLAEKFGRSAAEDEETGLSWTAVGKNPQEGEEVRPALYLIDDYKTPEIGKGKPRISKPCKIGRILEVEALPECAALFQDIHGKGCLSYLPGSQNGYDGKLSKQVKNDLSMSMARYHGIGL